MSQFLADLLERHNYSRGLQLQSRPPLAGMKGGFDLKRALFPAHTSCRSHHQIRFVLCEFPLQAPSVQSWPPAMSACSSPLMQETHGDRWVLCFCWDVMLLKWILWSNSSSAVTCGSVKQYDITSVGNVVFDLSLWRKWSCFRNLEAFQRHFPMAAADWREVHLWFANFTS